MIDIASPKTLDLNSLQPPMNVTLVTPTSGLPELKKFVESAKLMGFDTETNWCNDFYFRVGRTIQVGNKEQQFVIDLREFLGSLARLKETQGHYKMHEAYKPIFDILTPALCGNSVLKVGQNLSFEYQVMLWNFGQRIWHLYSTDLAERTIQAGAIGLKKMTEFSMKAIVARRFGVLIDKEEQDTFGNDEPLTPNQIQYAAFDVRMPLSMREHQIGEMTKAQLLSTALIENDVIGAFQDMHLNGMRMDSERWMKRFDATIERRQHELKILDETFIPVMGKKTEHIDFEEMARRENVWRTGFELPTAEEMSKAEEIRCTRDNAKKAELRAQLDLLKKDRAAFKKEAKAKF